MFGWLKKIWHGLAPKPVTVSDRRIKIKGQQHINRLSRLSHRTNISVNHSPPMWTTKTKIVKIVPNVIVKPKSNDRLHEDIEKMKDI